MRTDTIIKELRRIMVDEHRCLGCGYEHSCSTRGCAIMRAAAERLEDKLVDDRQFETDKNVGGKWISVDEKLPEDDRRVLVVCRTKKGIQSVNLAYYWNGAWHGQGSMAGVTHWMALPEPAGEND